MVIFEYPSGVLADKFPKKYIYIVSQVLLTVTYLLVLNTDRYLLLITAGFVYGISTAAETGTVDSDIIIWIKENNSAEEVSKKIKKFIGTSGQISSLSAITGACLGFALYKIIDINIYLVMTALILFAGLLIACFYKIPDRETKANERNIMAIVKDSFKEIKETKYNEIINVGNISSVTSLFSTIMRLFGCGTLLISSRFIGLFSIKALFLVIPLIVFAMICFILDRHVIRS